MEDITIHDVKAFVASRGPDEPVGKPLWCSACLLASTIRWMHPEIAKVSVNWSNQYASVELKSGEEQIANFSQEAEASADRFDRIGNSSEPVTRRELEDLMPELFG